MSNVEWKIMRHKRFGHMTREELVTEIATFAPNLVASPDFDPMVPHIHLCAMLDNVMMRQFVKTFKAAAKVK